MRTAKEISKSIAGIKQRGLKLDLAIQSVALEVLEHISQYPEASLACKLYQAMPKGSRRNALVAWFLEYGAIKVNTGKNKDAVPLLWAKDKATDLVGAGTKPWYEFKPEKAPAQEFDLDKKLQSFLSQVKKAQTEGTLKASNDEVLATLLKLAQ